MLLPCAPADTQLPRQAPPPFGRPFLHALPTGHRAPYSSAASCPPPRSLAADWRAPAETGSAEKLPDTTIFYVDARNGSDTNHGRTASAPFKTLNRAATSVKPGWTVQVMSGTYTPEGSANPLELTACGKCGSAFLADAKETVKVSLPVIGNITELSTGARVALMIGGGTLVTVLFFVMLLALDHIF